MTVHCHAGRGEYKSLRARCQYIVMLVEVSISISGQGASTLSYW